MKTKIQCRFILLLVPILLTSTAFGDVEIRDAIFLSPASRQRSVSLCETNLQARAAHVQIEQEAHDVLNDIPRPLSVLYYEGILGTDPRRQDTEDHLRDMDKLALVTMAFYGNPRLEYTEFIKRFVFAWATMYIPTGNPIDENKLEAIYCGYYLVREKFSQTERERVEAWLQDIVEKENLGNNTGNWETKRFKIIGEIGLALNRQDLMNIAVERYKRYVVDALFNDGSTHDFQHRDALLYHCGGLRPLVIFCLIAEQMQIRIENKSLYEWETANGGSVKKSVHFLDPYVRREKEHVEFVNSAENFDRQRCEAGLSEYCPKPWNPSSGSAFEIYGLACCFEPDLSPMVAGLVGSSNTEFPTWLTVITKASSSATATWSPQNIRRKKMGR